jgi:hypothetical protein
MTFVSGSWLAGRRVVVVQFTAASKAPEGRRVPNALFFLAASPAQAVPRSGRPNARLRARTQQPKPHPPIPLPDLS